MNSLRNKLWLGFGGLLFILVVVSVLTLVVLTRYSRTLERVFHENYNSAMYCDNMKSALDQINSSAQRLIWDVPNDNRQTDIEANRFDSNLKLQLNNCTLPGEVDLSRQLANLWGEYRRHFQPFTDNSTNRPALYRQDLLPRYQQMKQVAQRVADMNMANMVSVDGQAKETLIGVRNALLILVTAATFLALFLVVMVVVSLQSPLQLLTQSARQIESGDLDLNLAVKSRDEIGQLAEAFNAMALRLREFRRSDHEKLSRIQQTTQLAIDSLSDAVLVISATGQVEISNRTAQTHFGIKPDANLSDLQLPWVKDIHSKVMAEGQPLEPIGYSSAIQLFENGHERFLLPHAVPMFSAAGNLIGVTVILVDVTRLRRADELKSGLLSMVSHELRTPLTSIRMALAMTVNQKLGPLTVKQAKVLTAAREDSERLHGIIENLLNMSRIEAGNVKFQFRRMTATEIVSLAVDPVRDGISEKGLRLVIEIPPDLGAVQADPSCIGLALTNLLSNAQKFTPPGGEIRVDVEQNHDDLIFAVSDSGPGISKEYADRIFEKFFRIPHKEGPTGAGLGLSIAKDIAEAHGGSVQFRGNGGSTFILKLPREHISATGVTEVLSGNSHT
jgi:two-component system, NtrC family, sensor histidine kinase KinB